MIPELLAAGTAGVAIGMLAMSYFDRKETIDLIRQRDFWRKHHDGSRDAYLEEFSKGCEAAIAHDRLSDALATKQSRIDRALEQATPGANATVQRIAVILKGER